SMPKVHTFRAAGSYSRARFGIDWLRNLLESHGRDHWCVVVDADEFFVYPGWEYLSIPDLCDYLDSESSSAFASLLLDMYSGKPFARPGCWEVPAPQAGCPSFDIGGIDRVEPFPPAFGGRERSAGGMRKACFWAR